MARRHLDALLVRPPQQRTHARLDAKPIEQRADRPYHCLVGIEYQAAVAPHVASRWMDLELAAPRLSVAARPISRKLSQCNSASDIVPFRSSSSLSSGPDGS
jgi:hypothetical protein